MVKSYTLTIDGLDLHRVLTALAWAAGSKSELGNEPDANLDRALYNVLGRAALGDKHRELPMQTPQRSRASLRVVRP